MKEQKYASTKMVTANVIRGYKNHIQELQEKMEQYSEEISRASNLVEHLEGLVEMDEEHETTIEDVVKFISTASEHDKDLIRSALGIDNNTDETEWAVYYKHISQITQHATLPNITILENLVEKCQGLTQMEVAERIGFLSTGKIFQLNKLLESYGLGRIGLKKERTVTTTRKQCGNKIRDTKKKRIERMVEMTNELNKK